MYRRDIIKSTNGSDNDSQLILEGRRYICIYYDSLTEFVGKLLNRYDLVRSNSCFEYIGYYNV